jgi:LPS-assembly lipoprotein
MWSSEVNRRTALRTLGAGLVAAGLAGCGFRLRGETHLNFRSIRLAFPPRSLMGAELERQLLRVQDMRVVEAEKDAEVVMDVLTDRVDRTASATTSVGQVREISIITRLRFRVRTPAGRVLIPETELALGQPLTYSEEQAQAKESEEAQLVQGMRRDIAAQVIRRLETVKL